jgi:hypothetical protein
MSETRTAWLVTTGSYSDYTVIAVTLTQADAQAYAAAYNAERESAYRDDAEVEEVELWRDGEPLPRRITLWNGDERSTWPITFVTTSPEEFQPKVDAATGLANRRVFVQNFPSEEAARTAAAEALKAAR